MRLEHSFSVPVPIDEAWKILLDIELIGPCMPGAAIDSVTGDDFTGSVKVKLGPIGLTYKGKASFIEKDEAAHKAVIDARGKDARGNGTASAKVTATLSERGGETHVQVDTDLDITGKPAQFGRGVMVDVGNKLIGQFSENLRGVIDADHGGAAPAAAPEAAAAPAKKAPAKKSAVKPADAGQASSEGASGAPEGATESPVAAESATAGVPESAASNGAPARKTAPPRDVEPINLIESAGPAVAKRLAPVAVALVVVLLAVRRFRKH